MADIENVYCKLTVSKPPRDNLLNLLQIGILRALLAESDVTKKIHLSYCLLSYIFVHFAHAQSVIFFMYF
jgi:hypothetical protein